MIFFFVKIFFLFLPHKILRILTLVFFFFNDLWIFMPFSNKLIKKHENTEMLSGILFSLSFFFF